MIIKSKIKHKMWNILEALISNCRRKRCAIETKRTLMMMNDDSDNVRRSGIKVLNSPREDERRQIFQF